MSSGAPIATACAMRMVMAFFLLFAAGRADAGELLDFEKHVRTTDRDVRELVRDAMNRSPSLRTLVARLVRSDVIVYVMREHGLASQADGQLNIMATVGGRRYVAVRVAWERTPRRQAAIIAHELQHAVEIADAPWVVDDATLATEYERMGAHRPRLGVVKAFDTGAAVLAGEHAWLEYGSGADALENVP